MQYLHSSVNAVFFFSNRFFENISKAQIKVIFPSCFINMLSGRALTRPKALQDFLRGNEMCSQEGKGVWNHLKKKFYSFSIFHGAKN